MLFKRGSTISAAEGGCQAEVGGAFEVICYFASSIAHNVYLSCLFDGQCWVCGVYGGLVPFVHLWQFRSWLMLEISIPRNGSAGLFTLSHG
jgi:hypothetical protein